MSTRTRPLATNAVALSRPEAENRLATLSAQWQLEEHGGMLQLVRQIRTKDFAGALQAAQRIGIAADSENHHPQLEINWGRLTVRWWTHKIHGLSDNDFVMAAITDELIPPS